MSNNYFLSVMSAFLLPSVALCQLGAPGGEWPTYGGDLGHTRYSALDQIDSSNFSELEVAWTFDAANFGPSPEYRYQSTPLMINGRVFTTAGSRRAVVSLDAKTGEILWMHSLDEGERGEYAPRQLSGRGLAYWVSEDGSEERVIYVTPGYRMMALDAVTGNPVASFGDNGIVDLKQDADQQIDLITGEIGLHSTPIVAKDVVIVGAAHRTGGNPRSRENVKGYVRGFNVLTGERLWIFHTIPEPGEYGNESWLNESSIYTGNTGVWAQISVDLDLETVYLPVEAATGDYYGAYRPGDNLFSDSIVAVDIKTGERQWHYQLTHHDVWDWDIPGASVLADLPNGNRVLMSVTKQSWVYTFDRETGEPIWPIEELPVPAGDVPGEWYSPTQPIPSRPAPFDRQGFTEDDLIDWTPEIKALALEAIEGFRLSPSVYSPPSLQDAADGTRGTLGLPSATGGANWEGSALDPDTGILYVPSRTALAVLSLNNDENSDLALSQSFGVRVPRVQGLEIAKPPYGRITAIDMNSGDHVWMIANADTPDSCLLYTSPSPRDGLLSRMPSSA